MIEGGGGEGGEEGIGRSRNGRGKLSFCVYVGDGRRVYH